MSTPTDVLADPFDDIPMADSSRASTGASGKKKRVGFTENPGSTHRTEANSNDRDPGPASAILAPTQFGTPPNGSQSASPSTTPLQGHDLYDSTAEDLYHSEPPELSLQQTQEIHQALRQSLQVPKPRPAIRRTSSALSVHTVLSSDPDDSEVDEHRAVRKARAREALERGQQLANDERILSASNSRNVSPETLQRFQEDAADEYRSDDSGLNMPRSRRSPNVSHMEAFKLVRNHTRMDRSQRRAGQSDSVPVSGASTPREEADFDEDYVPRPEKYRGGVLGSLLKLYGQANLSSGARHGHSRSGSYGSVASTPAHSPSSSGRNTPTGSYFAFGQRHKSPSGSSLSKLVGSSAALGSPSVTGLGEQVFQHLRERQGSSDKRKGRRKVLDRLGRSRAEEEARITIHIAETMSRQKYLMRLCRALMLYGAPTHRLEEYMNMSARVLEVRAQFLYIPGSMIMSFDDTSTHTTEVKLVRVDQGLDLGRLRDAHEIYKDVVHDRIGVDEAMSRLKHVSEQKVKFSKILRIPIYGLAAAAVGPFAFGARWIDLPIAWALGCILGGLQLYVATKSQLYSNVFEIAATIITSFLARAFGSIRGGDLFCFSALAQSSIALILPGYTVLCASLELQSKQIVAGSIRMVYAIIYSLFLGYGITIGSAIYGLMDVNATSRVECHNSMSAPLYFVFVPIFTICLIIINQAKWKQAPVMLLIACVGYIVNYYSSQRFKGSAQVSNTLGALAIGVIANLYSRIGGRLENRMLDVWEDGLRPRWRRVQNAWIRKPPMIKTMEEGHSAADDDKESVYVRQTRRVGYGLAAAAMLPAIFVQVPSGLAVQGSLISGVASANEISTGSNGTSVATSSTLISNEAINSTAFVTAYSVIQIAIGITVGLFMSAVLVYPFGKKRSGLFSF